MFWRMHPSKPQRKKIDPVRFFLKFSGHPPIGRVSELEDFGGCESLDLDWGPLHLISSRPLTEEAIRGTATGGDGLFFFRYS